MELKQIQPVGLGWVGASAEADGAYAHLRGIWSLGLPALPIAGGVGLRVGKRVFDIAVSLLCLPLVAVLMPVIWLCNLRFNPGPLLYRQERMGRNCEPFTIWKFRSMLPGNMARGHDDPLEIDRITPLGALMRRTRIDELPQLLNVLRGEMSLIGPRPDAYGHALAYLDLVPNYRVRYAVRPGLSGLAQTELGYAEGLEATARKTSFDLAYVRCSSWRLEAMLVWRTLNVVVSGLGAR